MTDSTITTEIEDNPSFDNGVTYAIEHLAQLLGVSGWRIREGSEDYATDVANTIDGVLELAGIRNDETGEIVRQPLQDFVEAAAGGPLQPWQRALLEAIESRKNYQTKARGGAKVLILPTGKDPRTMTDTATTLQQLKASIDTRINDLLCETKAGYDDSVVGINEAWDVVRQALDEYIARATGETVLEQSETLDGRLAQTVRLPDGSETVRLVGESRKNSQTEDPDFPNVMAALNKSGPG